MAISVTSSILLFSILMQDLVGLNITLQGSSQYVVPGQPFTFTCILYSNKTFTVVDLFKDNNRSQAVQHYEDKCYNVINNPLLCDPLFCSCSKQENKLTVTWTLSSIYSVISTWTCSDGINVSPPLILRTTGLNITLQGSRQYVVPGQPFTFTCILYSNNTVTLVDLFKDNNRSQAVQHYADKCYNVIANPLLCDPLFCSCSKQENILTVTWTLSSIINAISTWTCADGFNVSPPLILRTTDPPPNQTATIKDIGNVLSISQGTPITLQCEVRGGNPLAVINWNCFGGTVTNTTVSGKSRSNITFIATTALNGKICICSATHTAGIIQKDSVQINVTYGPKIVTLQPSRMYYSVNETYNLGPIQCSANCNPNCSFTWIGPGSSTITGSILQIKSIKKEQAGNYFCTASNYLGKNTKGDVTVIVNYGPDSLSLQPPNLMYIGNENQSIGPIQCSADCYPNCSFTWAGPGSSTHTGSILQINSMKKEQAGNYFCIARNNLGTKTSENVTVTVNYKPKALTLNPPYLKYIRIEHNQLEPINCTADCSPECNYVWNGPTSVNERTLKILNIQRDQEGQYKCIAFNKFGNLSSREVVVTVNYGPDYPVILNPSFTNYVVNETYQFGPIKCSATCKPPCTYKWIIPGQNEVQGNNLTIFNVRRSQTGLYQCIANNSVSSRSSRNVDVTVHYAANMTSFKISGNNLTIKEHSTPTITCEAEGLPVPQITLRHVKNKTIIFQTTDDHLKYKFPSARCEDTGEYKCEAVNKFNQQSLMTKNIYVLCSPRPINIADKDRHNAYGYGETLNLSIIYLAYPKPKFKWYFKNSQTSNKTKLTNGSEEVEIYNTFKYQSEVYRHVSNIIRKSLQEDYFGIYLLYVKNEVPSESTYSVSTFSVVPLGNPTPPSEVIVDCFLSANVTWTAQYNNGATQTFYIRYITNGKNRMLPKIKDPGFLKKVSIEIDNLEESSSYTFQVIAVNEYGETTSRKVFCTTHSKPEKINQEELIIGSYFGGFITALIIVAVVTFACIRLRTNKNKNTGDVHNGCIQSRYEDIQMRTTGNTYDEPTTLAAYEDTRPVESDQMQYETLNQSREYTSTYEKIKPKANIYSGEKSVYANTVIT